MYADTSGSRIWLSDQNVLMLLAVSMDIDIFSSWYCLQEQEVSTLEIDFLGLLDLNVSNKAFFENAKKIYENVFQENEKGVLSVVQGD